MARSDLKNAVIIPPAKLKLKSIRSMRWLAETALTRAINGTISVQKAKQIVDMCETMVSIDLAEKELAAAGMEDMAHDHPLGEGGGVNPMDFVQGAHRETSVRIHHKQDKWGRPVVEKTIDVRSDDPDPELIEQIDNIDAPKFLEDEGEEEEGDDPLKI